MDDLKMLNDLYSLMTAQFDRDIQQRTLAPSGHPSKIDIFADFLQFLQKNMTQSRSDSGEALIKISEDRLNEGVRT